MAGVEILQGSCEGQQTRLWEDIASEIDLPSAVGQTGETASSCCCCDHTECADFRKKAWCKRLFLIQLSNIDREGQALEVSGLKALVGATLFTRSYKDFSFPLVDLGQRNQVDAIVVVFLADGEPPITSEEVRSWNDRAPTVCAKQGICFVKVMRCPCCSLGAKEAMNRLFHLYLFHLCLNQSDDDDKDSELELNRSVEDVLGELAESIWSALGTTCT